MAVRKAATTTIEDARKAIMALLPKDSSLFICASWHDYNGRHYSSHTVTYSCHLIHRASGLDITVESKRPDQLCGLLMLAMQRAQQPPALPPAKSVVQVTQVTSREPPPARPKRLEPAARTNLPAPAAPRLPVQQPLLPY